MPIFGVGVDIVSNERIGKFLDRYGERFLLRFFAPAELESFYKIQNRQLAVNFLAKRVAAKEAFAKAAGTGFTPLLTRPSVWVLSLPSGKPVISLTPRAQDFLTSHCFPPGGTPRDPVLHCSLSDEREFSVANVVIET